MPRRKIARGSEFSIENQSRSKSLFGARRLHCAGGAKLFRFFGIFSPLWWQIYAFTANFQVPPRFVQGTNTLAVPCRVSATGDMSLVSPPGYCANALYLIAHVSISQMHLKGADVVSENNSRNH